MAKLALVVALGGVASAPGAAWAHNYGYDRVGDCEEVVAEDPATSLGDTKAGETSHA